LRNAAPKRWIQLHLGRDASPPGSEETGFPTHKDYDEWHKNELGLYEPLCITSDEGLAKRIELIVEDKEFEELIPTARKTRELENIIREWVTDNIDDVCDPEFDQPPSMRKISVNNFTGIKLNYCLAGEALLFMEAHEIDPDWRKAMVQLAYKYMEVCCEPYMIPYGSEEAKDWIADNRPEQVEAFSIFRGILDKYRPERKKQ
jgi:hypothetical protein